MKIAQLYPTVCGPMDCRVPWNSPGQNTTVDSLSLLQGFFPTQGSNPGLLHCRQILYQLSHNGCPRILKWVAYPKGSSRPRNWTRVSCIAGEFFTNRAIRVASKVLETNKKWFWAGHSHGLPVYAPFIKIHGWFMSMCDKNHYSVVK